MPMAYPILGGVPWRQVIRSGGNWTRIIRPLGARMFFASLTGGGGGGGNGFTAATGAARGGGGGGGGAGKTKIMIPADDLPEEIWGFCGAGGAAVTAGGVTRLSLFPDNTTPAVIVLANGGNAGGTGTGAAAGAGATAAAAFAAANGPLHANAVFTALAGIAGTAGGTQAGGNGAAFTPGNSGTDIIGGTGGGGTTSADFAGGQINATGYYPALSGGSAGSNRGRDGYDFNFGITLYYSGTGGGSSNTGVGGGGGNGATGCGGGGGGGGTTGGTGGRGGDGLIIVQWS